MRPAGIALSVLLLFAAAGYPRQLEVPRQPGSQLFFPKTLSSNTSLFGALREYGKNSDDDRLLRSRGYIRSFNFHYKNFSYERNFFHVYKGFTLHEFMDGKFDVGLYKHRVSPGLLFGPAGAYLPSNSNRIELIIRWNLSDR